MKKTFKKFWMVTNKPMKGKDNRTTVRHRHYTKELAETEAQRLADIHGRPFVVMTTLRRFNPSDA